MKTNTVIRRLAVLGLNLGLVCCASAASFDVALPTTYKIVGNPLDNPPNTLSTALPISVAGISTAQVYSPDTSYTFATKKGSGAWSPNLPLPRGEAAYVKASAPTVVTISGAGSVTPVDLTTTIGFDPLHKFYLRTSQVVDPNTVLNITNSSTVRNNYHDITGTDPVDGVAMYLPLPSGPPAPPATPLTTPGQWEVHVFKYGAWSSGEPTIGLGEGAWIGPEPVGPLYPWVIAASPTHFNTSCGGTVTLHGGDFSATATVELLPGAIPCPGAVVNGAGTEITVNVPGGLSAGNYSIVVRNTATEASVPFGVTIGGPKIKSVWPYAIGNCDPVKISITAAGLCPGATVVATPVGGGSPVTPTLLTPGAAGDTLSATFDFSGNPSGSYDLTVQNPGAGGSDTVPYGLTVGGLQGWLAPYEQPVGNCGAFSVSLNGWFCAGDEVQLVSSDGSTTLPGTVAAITEIWPGFKLLTANFNSAPVKEYHAEVRRGGGAWKPVAGKLTVYDVSGCPLFPVVEGRTRVGYTRINGYSITVHNLGCSAVGASTLKVSFPASDNPAFSTLSANGTAVSANEVDFAIPALAAGAVETVTFQLQLPNLSTTCNMSVVETLSGCNAMSIPFEVVASQDPNSKEGLEGIGAGHAIVGNETLPYEIHFENKAIATAPAQDVFITDRLDPAKFDLSTFSLGEIKFGNRVITPPSGLTSYSEIITHDRDGNPATTADIMLLVLNGELVTDVASPDLGRLTWSYRTLDPATMNTPLDPDLGFLPPNTVSPIGEGSVKFSVKLNPGLSPGTRMGSEAVIIFDANAPIATNPWFNEIATNPILVIRPNGDQVEIEWVSTAGAYTLEETSQLGTGAAWTTVGTAPVSVTGTLQRVTLTPDGGQRFFRLRR